MLTRKYRKSYHTFIGWLEEKGPTDPEVETIVFGIDP